MSILIKGISSLKDGLYQIQDGKIHAYKGKGGKTEGYDLIEVPSPHGRLIDGDNVIDLLREQLTGDRDTVYEYYDDGLEMAISELSIVPTIIEAEEGEEK